MDGTTKIRKRLILGLVMGLGIVSGRLLADVTTTRMGLTEPALNSSGWGTTLNNNFGIIDSSAAILSQTNTFTAVNTFTQPITASQGISFGDSTSQTTAFSGSNISVTTATITHLIGTTTNDNATRGTIGEYISSNSLTYTNFGASGAYGDLVNVVLSSGDWDISECIDSSANGGTITELLIGISTNATTGSTNLTAGDTLLETIIPTSSVDGGGCLTNVRQSLAAGTTVYFKIRSSYSVNQPKGTGRISARRLR